MKFALRLAINFVVVLALAGVLTVNASASTIPGDPLYGVKRTWETVHLALTVQEPVRQQLQAQMVAERRAEIGRLLQLHRNIVVEFDGVLEQITVDQIVVSGIEINITPQTVIEGIPVVGRGVEMRVSVQSDGKLIAQELHFEDSGSRGKATSTATVIPPIVPPGLPGADDHGDDDCGDDDKDDGRDDDCEDDDIDDDDIDDDDIDDDDDDDGEED